MGRIIIRIIIVVLSVMNVSSLVADEHEKEILVLGDSLSAAYGIDIDEGWVHLLSQRLAEQKRNWKVRNVSISGSTTDNGVVMLEKALEHNTPEIVLVELGANDGLRGFPIAAIDRNLRNIIQTSKAIGSLVLLVQIELPRNYGKIYTDAFSNIYRRLAEKEEVELLPFLLVDVFGSDELMQDDQLHPTALAQPIILDTLWDHIDTATQHK